MDYLPLFVALAFVAYLINTIRTLDRPEEKEKQKNMHRNYTRTCTITRSYRSIRPQRTRIDM